LLKIFFERNVFSQFGIFFAICFIENICVVQGMEELKKYLGALIELAIKK